MTFGAALEALKARKCVARAGWNGKCMFLIYVPGGEAEHPLLPTAVEALPYIAMITAQGAFVPWLASQTDILSEDWGVVE